jgi:hypothetical protein
MNSATKAESPGEGPCDPAGLLMQYQLIPLVLFTWLLVSYKFTVDNIGKEIVILQKPLPVRSKIA